MSDLTKRALAELYKHDPEEALALLDAAEDQRRDEKFIAYWEPFEHEKIIFDSFKPEIKILSVTGGNRSGKTETGAAIATAWALGKSFFLGEPAARWVDSLPIPEPPNNIWVVGLDFNVLRDVIWREKLIQGNEHPGFIPKIASGLIEKIADSDKQIFFSNGSILTCKSADSGREKFQGASVDLVWIDEEPEEEIYDECYQRTADCAGKILITLTPLTDISSGVRNPWVYDLYEKMRAGDPDIAFVSLSVLDNPKVPAEEKERLLKKWAGDPEEKARLYGQFVQRTGLVYPMWNPKKHIIKSQAIPKHWLRVVSIDPAATGVTAALWIAVNEKGDLYCYREYYKDGLVVFDHAKNILVRNTGDPIDIWLIDPKWGSQRNAETHRTNQQLYRDAGIPVRLAELGEDFGLNASREYVQATTDTASRHPKLFVSANLNNFIHEIEHYTWDTFQRGPLKGLSKDKPKKHSDHLMNCFQYACGMRPKMRQRLVFQRTKEEQLKESQLNSYFQ